MSEAVVLCEGYDDRAFWAGWLVHRGCPAPDLEEPVLDPMRNRVTRGHFGFYTPTKGFVRLVPCSGKANILPAMRDRLADRRLTPLSRLVVCVDPDTCADSGSAATGLRAEDILREVRAIEASAKRNEAGDIELDGGVTKVMLVRWQILDADAAGVPIKQTLERLVCSAIVGAYPERGPAVDAWLASRPSPPAASPKEHAWSHMAGWYAKFGCSAFYKELWSDPKVVAELETRLRACGAWRVAEELLK